jgi:AraC-like DNA-binding protein
MNHLTQNIDLQFKPFFFHYRKQSQGKFEIYHAHKGMEFMFIHEGTGSVYCEQKRIQVLPGTLLCFHPFQLHRLVMEPLVPFIRTIIIFEPVVIDPYLRFLPRLHAYFRQFLQHNPFSFMLDPMLDEHQQLLFLFKVCEQKQLTDLPKHQLESFVVFMIAFIQQLQFYTPQPQQQLNLAPDVHLHNHVEKIIQWIEEHYMDDFSLDELVKELHLSPYHISHLFQKAMGSSISVYLTNCRMREACLLLKTNSLPLKDVAGNIGMTSASHFCTVFKKTMNMTPQQYRKMLVL